MIDCGGIELQRKIFSSDIYERDIERAKVVSKPNNPNRARCQPNSARFLASHALPPSITQSRDLGPNNTDHGQAGLPTLTSRSPAPIIITQRFSSAMTQWYRQTKKQNSRSALAVPFCRRPKYSVHILRSRHTLPLLSRGLRGCL